MDGWMDGYLQQVGEQFFITFHMFWWGHSHPVDHRVHSLLIKQVQLRENTLNLITTLQK